MPYIVNVGKYRVNLYMVREFADLTGISYRSAVQYIKDERIPAVKIKGRWYISERNIVLFLNGARMPKHGSVRTGRYPPRDGPKIPSPEYTQYYPEKLV